MTAQFMQNESKVEVLSRTGQVLGDTALVSIDLGLTSKENS